MPSAGHLELTRIMDETIMADLLGQMVGKYKITHLLGRGGMGSVYRAWDQALQRDVAIKVMHPHLAEDPVFQQRFLQEARTAARLNHPNVVQVHDLGKQGDLVYMVMEYIPGQTLAQRLRANQEQGRHFAVPEALELVRQVALALAYAHEQNVLHRDIKPANVMLKPETAAPLGYRPILTDFGLARLGEGSGLTQTGVSMGTPAYMAPEQIMGDPVDARSDLYALGILLYEVLVGQLPYAASSMSQAFRYHAQGGQPTPPRQYKPDLPAALDRVILQALAKAPADRFQNATQFAQALTRLEPSGGAVTEPYIHRPPPTPPRRAWQGRRLAPIFLLVAFALVVWQFSVWLPALIRPASPAAAPVGESTPPVEEEAGGAVDQIADLAVVNDAVTPTTTATVTPVPVDHAATQSAAATATADVLAQMVTSTEAARSVDAAQTRQAATRAADAQLATVRAATMTAQALVATQTAAVVAATATVQALRIAQTREAEARLQAARTATIALLEAHQTAVAGGGKTQAAPVIDSLTLPLTFQPGAPFELDLSVRNGGATAQGGGGITVSLPQGGEIEIISADVRVLPPNWSDCNYSQPNAWLRTAAYPCRKVLRFGSLCPVQTLTLQQPMVELWEKPWSGGVQHFLQLRITPPTDVREFPVYIRAAGRTLRNSCDLAIEPTAGLTGATDQQGFPVYALVVTAEE
ncbi:MAG: serine/threonine-protein kinase [Caldilineaceae bacterium]